MEWNDLVNLFMERYRATQSREEDQQSQSVPVIDPALLMQQPAYESDERMMPFQGNGAGIFDVTGINDAPIEYASPNIPQSSPFDIAGHAAKYAGNVGYKLGGKDVNSGAVDCSGLVCDVFGSLYPQVSGASADIMQNVAKGTSFELVNPTIDQLQENMIIGLNADPNVAGGGGYKGIDHVGIVFRDPASGALKVYESNSKQGVTTTDAEKYLERYRGRDVPMYAVNPILLNNN